MGRRIKGERIIYIRPLDAAQLKANYLIINDRLSTIFKYGGIHNGGRVIIVDEFGRKTTGKMQTGKNTYLRCHEWFLSHPELRESDLFLIELYIEEGRTGGKTMLKIGKLSNTQTIMRVVEGLPPPPEKVVLRRRPGRPRKEEDSPQKKLGRKKSRKETK